MTNKLQESRLFGLKMMRLLVLYHVFVCVCLNVIFFFWKTANDDTRFCLIRCKNIQGSKRNENHKELWPGYSYLFYPNSLQQLSGNKM